MEDDREKLGPVLQSVVRCKLLSCLKAQDLPAYRRHLNLQPFYFRGLAVESVEDLVPGFDASYAPDLQAYVVAKFLHQNGLRSVREVDGAGWTALHYAALGGNSELIAGLLQQRAEPNRRTAKDEPNLGVAIWTSALDPWICLKHPENHLSQMLSMNKQHFPQSHIPLSKDLAVIYGNNDGARMLIQAGARLKGLLGPVMHSAAVSDNDEGVLACLS